MFRATSRPAREGNFCTRCGVPVNKPRPGAQCGDCRYTTDFEAAAERRGVDLAALGEDEFLNLESKKHLVVRDPGWDLNEQDKAA